MNTCTCDDLMHDIHEGQRCAEIGEEPDDLCDACREHKAAREFGLAQTELPAMRPKGTERK
jgi:hypothetical protein